MTPKLAEAIQRLKAAHESASPEAWQCPTCRIPVTLNIEQATQYLVSVALCEPIAAESEAA